MYVETTYRGLRIEGEAAFYDCSHSGPHSEASLQTVELDDVDDLDGWGLLDDLAPAVGQAAFAAMRISGRLLPLVRARILDRWADAIETELAAEA